MALIKTLSGLAYASVKARNGLVAASIKTINGLDASGYDPDAQNYFDQIAIVGSTIDATARTAINDFVVGCKTDSIWTLLLDVGPLCGDNVTAALVKLKTLSGSWSYVNHNFIDLFYSQATGLTGNHFNLWLGSGVLGTDLTTNSTGIGVYDRDTGSAGGSIFGEQHGAYDDSTHSLLLIDNYSDGNAYSEQYDGANQLGYGVFGIPLGFLFGTRPASNSHSFYRNGSVIATTSTTGGSLPSSEIEFMKATGFDSHPSAHTFGFFCLTLGMDDTQAAALYTRVQALQTALGRNV